MLFKEENDGLYYRTQYLFPMLQLLRRDVAIVASRRKNVVPGISFKASRRLALIP